MLHVEIQKIYVLQNARQLLPLHITTGLQCRVHKCLLAASKEGGYKLCLHSSLPASHGDAPVRPSIEEAVLLDLFEQFFDRHLASHNFPCPVGAEAGARTARGTTPPIYPNASRAGEVRRSFRAILDALPTFPAAPRIVENFRLSSQRMGRGTPSTSQGTTFQVYQSPDSRSVMSGKTLKAAGPFPAIPPTKRFLRHSMKKLPYQVTRNDYQQPYTTLNLLWTCRSPSSSSPAWMFPIKSFRFGPIQG